MKRILNFKFQISNKSFEIARLRRLMRSICGRGYWKLDIGNFSKGFTLVELLIYMGIMTILLGVLTQIFSSILDVQLDSEATSAVDQDSRYLQARLTFDVLRATSIDIPVSLGSSNQTLQLTINGVTHTYSLVNGNVQLVNNLGSDVLNSSGTQISNLSFLRLGNVSGKNSVRISFRTTSQATVNARPEVRDMQTTIGIR